MSKLIKQISNPSSTGGEGYYFETRVQACFVALMLTNGFAPCLPNLQITKLKFQCRYKGFNIDDLIVFTDDQKGKKRKIMCQVKHKICLTESDKTFNEVINSAWNDFKNDKVFEKGLDIIALITGPLSKTDTNDARKILEWARTSQDSKEFFEKVHLAKFSSKAKQKKLKAFRTNLKLSNDNIDVSDEDTFQFLKHFHLFGFDLDIKSGITLSLLHSHIGQFSTENSDLLWTKIVDEVQTRNINAGELTKDDLPDELIEIFKSKPIEKIPEDFTRSIVIDREKDWNKHHYATELSYVNLIGAWDENSDSDKEIIEQIANEEYSSWISKIREVLLEPNSPLKLKNGIWKIVDRKVLFNLLKTRIFDEQLESLKECAISVFSEIDPQIEYKSDERIYANIDGKYLKNSQSLRNGLAESLAIIGSNAKELTSCSENRPEDITLLCIREIFNDADWRIWGSLDHYTPLFAEASPQEFLKNVEIALQQSPCPFDELFAKESSGVFGKNYLVGLLWALETLAWDENYLVQVISILADLATHDPGGNWTNRPKNSIVSIFLPWLPQTTASSEKKSVALESIWKEYPEITWDILIELLPKNHQFSSGTQKPKWRNFIPESWNEGKVHPNVYWKEIDQIEDLLLKISQDNLSKLSQLINNLNHLTDDSIDNILNHTVENIERIKESEFREEVWKTVVKYINKNRRIPNADWSTDSRILDRIEDIENQLSPDDPLTLNQLLFCGVDSDHFEETGGWREQDEILQKKRESAIKSIYDFGGIEAIKKFIGMVEKVANVGNCFGRMADKTILNMLLPNYLELTDQNNKDFISGFIWGKYFKESWKWIDELNLNKWKKENIGQLFAYLPFEKATWERIEKILNKDEKEYWQRANVNPYQTDDRLDYAIEKLIQYNRPISTVDCLYRDLHEHKYFNNKIVVKVLIDALNTDEPIFDTVRYHILDLIEAIQNDKNTDPNDMFVIEWKYLPILREPSRVKPKYLNKRLSTHPDFFTELIQSIYKSKNSSNDDIEPTEKQKAIAKNAIELLWNWNIPPGLNDNGIIDKDKFEKWLDSVKEICQKSGHLDVALDHVGQVLFYSPPDPDGLWIDKNIALTLNGKDANRMRSGYRNEAFNSRGAHWVDPTAAPEIELSNKYTEKANLVENAGFHRFAITLRELAESYNRETERILNKYDDEGDNI